MMLSISLESRFIAKKPDKASLSSSSSLIFVGSKTLPAVAARALASLSRLFAVSSDTVTAEAVTSIASASSFEGKSFVSSKLTPISFKASVSSGSADLRITTAKSLVPYLTSLHTHTAMPRALMWLSLSIVPCGKPVCSAAFSSKKKRS